MKKIVLLLGILLISHCINAQDLLVIQGDSLNCKITKEDNIYIYFTFKHKSEVRNTLIEKYNVTAMQRDFYAQQGFATTEAPEIHIPVYNPLYIALSVGGGYRIAAAAPGYDKDYVDGLRLGVTAGADAYRYFNDYLGAGAKVLANWTSNSDYRMEDNIMTFFAGPVFTIRLLSASRKNALNMNIALGYLGYRNKGNNGSQTGMITANTFGAVLDYGYDIGLSQHVAIGFRLSLLVGGFSKVTLTSGGYSRTETLSDRENLSRIDLTVGIRFNSGKK